MLIELLTCLCKNNAFQSSFQRPHIYVCPYHLHLECVGLKGLGQMMGWEEREFLHVSIQANSNLEILMNDVSSGFSLSY